MRRLAIAFMMLALVCLVGCGGGAASQASGASASAGASNAAATSAQRTDKNGFDEAAGTPITVANTQFQLPSYYGEPKTGEDGSATYSGGNEAGLYTQTIAVSGKVTGFTDETKNAAKNVVLKALGDKAQVLSVEDSTVAGKPAVIIRATSRLNNAPIDSEFAFFCDTASNSIGHLWLAESSTGEYTYIPDFDRMIASAVALEPAPAATEQAPAADGVSPDVKEALDSYEAFMDEYVEFMQRYNESGNSSQMMVDYLNYLQKYTDFAAKIEKMDTNSMSSADYAYYIEVTSRVAQKLINVSM